MSLTTTIRLVFCLSSICLSGFSQTTVSGFVTSKATRQAIKGASVKILSDSTKGGMTNEQGFYSLKVWGSETIVLRFSAVGYYSSTRGFNPTSKIEYNISLEEAVYELEEVSVNAQKADDNLKKLETITKLDIKNLKRLPVVLGETDVIKALMFQSGISNAGEGAAGFNVRGGRTDQNLVLLDDMLLFNTSHLLGFFSNVNADYLESVQLYKSNLPIDKGGRIASLLAMRSSNAIPDEKLTLSGGVGVVSSKLSARYKINPKLAVVAATRVGYPNIFIKRAESKFNGARAFFYDTNAKIIAKPFKNHQFTISGYKSYDDFKFTPDTSYLTSSLSYSAAWESKLTDKLSVSALFSASQYKFNMQSLRPKSGFTLRQSLKQQDLNINASYSFSSISLHAGGYSSLIANSPGDLSAAGGESNINNFKGLYETGKEKGMFAEISTDPSKRISLQAGIRYSSFGTYFSGERYRYNPELPKSEHTITDTVIHTASEKISHYSAIDPRLTLKFQLNMANAIKLNFGQPVQYMHQFSNSRAISPVDFWKLSDEHIQPQRANSYSLGYFNVLEKLNLITSIELYYKDNGSLIEYRNGAQLLLNRNLETALLNAQGKTYGLEIELQKTKGKVTGLLTYTFARSWIKTPDINEGNWFPSNFDKPHILNLSANTKLGKGWSASLNFTYNTGPPITYPEGIYLMKAFPIAHFNKRNLDRIPDYHRMDIALVKEKKKSSWVFSIYNLYGQKNPYSIYFSRQYLVTRWYKLSVFGAAIPSLTYQFKL